MDELHFTEREQKWFNIKQECDKCYIEAQEAEERNWRDLYVTKGLSNYLEYALKYGNLRDPFEDICKRRNLIKINKSLPTKLLDLDGYEYVLFNGIYLVHDVIFVKKEICDKMFSHRNGIYRNADLGIPSEAIMGSVKDIEFEDTGRRYGVCLARSPFIDRYGTEYYSSWDYVYF